MPFTRRPKKPKRGRKKRYPSVYSRQLRVPSTYVFKMRLGTSLSTDPTGLINARINVNKLSLHWVPVAGAPGSPLLEVDQLKALFDNYMVSSVKFKYTPSMNTVSETGDLTSVPSELGNVPNLYIAYDPDNTGDAGTLNKVLTSNKVTTRSFLAPFSKKYAIQKVFQGVVGQPMLANGFNNLQNESDNGSGVIWIRSDFPVTRGDGTPYASKRIGNLFIETMVKFKNRN